MNGSVLAVKTSAHCPNSRSVSDERRFSTPLQFGPIGRVNNLTRLRRTER